MEIAKTKLARAGVVAAMMLAASGLCAHAAPPQSDRDKIERALWAKLLTPCGKSWFYVATEYGKRQVVELQEVRFWRAYIKLNDADKLNGYEQQFRIGLEAHVFKDGDDPYRESDVPKGKVIDYSDLQSAQDGIVGSMGSMSYDFVKTKGEWHIANDGANGGFDVGPTVNEFLATPHERYSCQPK